jgi:dTDP-4-dehydrorhamnose 3,5-epimerase
LRATRLEIPDVMLIESTVYEDERGDFFESYNQQKFTDATGVDVAFVQDNHSRSRKGVLRGLHFQRPPHAQGKLIRVVKGAVFDVAVDIRPGSPTRGQWVAETLSAASRRQIWVPPGFAHGFLALEDDTELLYKTTAFYNSESEGTIRWNDVSIGITWPDRTPILNSRDRSAPALSDIL